MPGFRDSRLVDAVDFPDAAVKAARKLLQVFLPWEYNLIYCSLRAAGILCLPEICGVLFCDLRGCVNV
jgi:hypothetical protein